MGYVLKLTPAVSGGQFTLLNTLCDVSTLSWFVNRMSLILHNDGGWHSFVLAKILPCVCVNFNLEELVYVFFSTCDLHS
jgi:hypothetical protein